jgi:hypothetical protein
MICNHRNNNRRLASWLLTLLMIAAISQIRADEVPEIIQTPYEEQKVVYDFFFDHPVKMHSALYWLRTHLFTLSENPYDIPTDFLDIKVIIHGTEIVTLAKKNYDRYGEIVERMRYYAELGVEFRVCAQSLLQYHYKPEDMQGFVKIIPAAATELTHWQSKGYALITPVIPDKNFTVDEIR